jgi:Oxygenase domain of the 2OGFeDO superfamily
MLGFESPGPGEQYRETPLTKKNPKMLTRNKSLIKLVNKLYKKYLPSIYEMQKAEVDKAPKCRLSHTAFSAIYLAKKFQTRYHRDRGNLKSAMTALMTMGDFTGGILIMPRWRLAFVLRPGDLLFFNPGDLHGNTPIEGERVSAAFYCGGGIADDGNSRSQSSKL